MSPFPCSRSVQFTLRWVHDISDTSQIENAAHDTTSRLNRTTEPTNRQASPQSPIVPSEPSLLRECMPDPHRVNAMLMMKGVLRAMLPHYSGEFWTATPGRCVIRISSRSELRRGYIKALRCDRRTAQTEGHLTALQGNRAFYRFYPMNERVCAAC